MDTAAVRPRTCSASATASKRATRGLHPPDQAEILEAAQETSQTFSCCWEHRRHLSVVGGIGILAMM